MRLDKPPVLLKPSPAAASSDPGEPGFSATAGDQMRASGDSAIERIRMKLRSILTPSQPVVDLKAFAGRRELLSQIVGAIEDQRLHVVLYGGRGMGKTSLLHVLTQRARDARYIVVYGSCASGTTFAEMFGALCEGIPLRYHKNFRAAAPEADERRTLSLLLRDKPITPSNVGDLLSGITGTRILMILDEFDRSDSGEFRQGVADLIKNLSDRSSRVQLVIGGVATNLSELIEHIPSIQRNILGMQIPPMSEKDVRHLFSIAQSQVGVTYNEEARSLISSTAAGWAYLTSLLAHHAALSAIRRKSTSVEAGDVRSAVRQAAEEIGGRLSYTSKKEIEVATAEAGLDCLRLAAKLHISTGGEFDASKLQSEGEASGENCWPIIQRLAEKDFLFRVRTDRFGTAVSFTDSTVPLYLWLLNAQGSLPERDTDDAQMAGFSDIDE